MKPEPKNSGTPAALIETVGAGANADWLAKSKSCHLIYSQLFKRQSLEVVRLIEGEA